MKKGVFLFAVVLQVALFANVDVAYKVCANCHGLAGEKAALNKSKIINQMSKEDFVAAMKGYKDGTYGGPLKAVMKGQVMKLSDKDMEELADKFIK